MFKNLLSNLLSYFFRVGNAISQLMNVTFLGGQYANESVSGRCYQNEHKSKAWHLGRRAIDYAFKKLVDQDGHCRDAFLTDLADANRVLKVSKERLNLPDYVVED